MNPTSIDLVRAYHLARQEDLMRGRLASRAATVRRLQRRAERLARKAERVSRSAERAASRARLVVARAL